MTKKYVVLDLETTGETTHKRFCNPFDYKHSITMLGFKEQGADVNHAYDKNGLHPSWCTRYINLDECSFIAGQNIKFDLMWLWSSPQLQNWLREGGKVWDTETAQYLLDGQDRLPRHLNNLAEKYGGTVKDDRVGTMFKAGIKANEIDPDILIPYGEADVVNTELVMLGQFKQLKKEGYVKKNILNIYMEHYLALCEIEYNGLYVDQKLLDERIDSTRAKVQEVQLSISQIIYNKEDYWNPVLDFKDTSRQHLSCYLFGGELPHVVDSPVLGTDQPVFYKSGKKKGEIRTRKVKYMAEIKGAGISTIDVPKSKDGYYKVDEAVLEKLLASGEGEKTQLIKRILELRKLNKLLGTYYRGLEEAVQPSTGCIHSSFQTSYLPTGRVSSREPNVQNLHPEMLDLFCSRWGDDGVIMEIDYSQLEVCIQAFVTQCKQMTEDIDNGIDFHCKRLSYIVPESYDEVEQLCKSDNEWKERRKKTKTISFQKSYGAQAEKLAATTGLSLENVTTIFQKEDEDYPEIGKYYEWVNECVEASTYTTNKLIDIKDKKTGAKFNRDGEQEAFGKFTVPQTGKEYTFKQRAVLTKHGKIFRWFSIPDMMNYPVQGTASDIFFMQVGALFRFAAWHRDKFLIVNEVHDSVILDVKKEWLDWTIRNVLPILEEVDDTFKRFFGIEFNVPIKCDYCVGANWKQAKLGV